MQETESKMEKAIEALQRELSTIRTGRANPQILDRVQAEYYGALAPINTMANISNQDGRTLLVQPFDKTALNDIEKAILASDLGLTPTNDGNRLIITMPELTADRRQELAKIAKKYGENAKISIRNARKDALNANKKNDEMTDDEKKGYEGDVQKVTDKFNSQIDTIVKEKETEITTL